MNQILIFCLAMLESKEDKDKFCLLYERYVGLLLYRARQYLQDEVLAEDAVEEAFIKVAQNMNKVEDVQSARTKSLLLRILERTAIDLYRRQQREQKKAALLEEQEQAKQYRQPEEQLADLIVELPEQYRGVLLLKYADGYQNKEIAEMLNYTVSKVDKLISRGKKMLWENYRR